MVDKKLTNPEPVSFRRSTMIRELALAKFHSRIDTPAAPAAPSVEPSLRRFRDNHNPPESGAKPWKKPWEI
jgi:hypothetical protein